MGSWHRTEQEGSGIDRPKACFHGWLAGWQERSTKKIRKIKHQTTPQRLSENPRITTTTKKQPKTPAEMGKERRGGSTSRSWFYLEGQWANRTGWPHRYNWTLGTYIHQSPLPWHWWARALPRPSCLCPSARGRRDEGQKHTYGNLLQSLVG